MDLQTLLLNYEQRKLANQLKGIPSYLENFFYEQIKDIESKVYIKPAIANPTHENQISKIPDSAFSKGSNTIKLQDIAIIILAAGDGTRLGSKEPKACVSINQKSLLQYHFDIIRELEKKESITIPIILLLSNNKGDLIIDHLLKNSYFGLKSSQISFIFQKDALFIDEEDQWVLTHPLMIGKGPAGNGEVIHALLSNAHILPNKKILSICPIDNPHSILALEGMLPSYGGQDLIIGAIKRDDAFEKVGILCQIEQQIRIVDYPNFPKHTFSDLVKYPFGNAGIYLINHQFLNHLEKSESLPFYKINKTINIYENESFHQKPIYRFERFITDIANFSRHTSVAVIDRNRCFAPIKELSDLEKAKNL